jgi:LacI family transcriptional regulator
MSETRRIALLLGQDIGFCRELIRGIRAYAIGKRGWVFQNASPERSVIQAFRQWKPHGVIAQLITLEVARDAIALRKPLVDTACCLSRVNAATVDVDHQAVGRLAAEHFLERGYRSFGFFGSDWAHYSKLREASYQLRLAEAGCAASTCYVEYTLRLRALREWKHAARRVQTWLVGLPKPVAIFATNDPPARELADLCAGLGLRVPDDVALLGVDNDDLECGLTSPPLSSIATPARQIGHEAARILDEMMSGRPAQREPVLLQPCGVVVRQSTDTLAINDPSVVTALNFIRTHIAEPIRVNDVVREVVLSRRSLEYKFHDLVGHSILEEIRRWRVQRVQELLGGTDLLMPAIARRSGFSSQRRMAVVFREVKGLTPTEYRRQAQGPAP